MRTDEESRELKERISQLPDEELLTMVEVEPHEYRKEALDYAKAELMGRGIQFQESRKPLDGEGGSTIGESRVMRKLASCTNIAQAGLLEGFLAGSGIACEIRRGSLSMALGEIPFTECYPELWVLADEEEFKRAQGILDEWRSQEVEQHDNWNCQGCGEENEGQFNSCWKCGRVETGSDNSTRT